MSGRRRTTRRGRTAAADAEEQPMTTTTTNDDDVEAKTPERPARPTDDVRTRWMTAIAFSRAFFDVCDARISRWVHDGRARSRSRSRSSIDNARNGM
jgi:hypothetical protein